MRFVMVALAAFALISCQPVHDDSVSVGTGLTGPYLGQNPPGTTAAIFAPGVVTVNYHNDGGPFFSPKGDQVYWRIAGKPHAFLLESRLVNGEWTSPEVAPFSGRYPDGFVYFQDGGDTLLVMSREPESGEGLADQLLIWKWERQGDTWIRNGLLDAPFNTSGRGMPNTIGPDGIIYTSMNDEGSKGGFDIWRWTLNDGKYVDLELLPGGINSEYDEFICCISPDGQNIVYSSDRPGSIGSDDLYVSFLQAEGTWSEGVNLGPDVNSEKEDKFPVFSPDGKYLFFSSNRPRDTSDWSYSKTRQTYAQMKEQLDFWYFNKPANHYCDTYWVSTDIFAALKQNTDKEE